MCWLEAIEKAFLTKASAATKSQRNRRMDKIPVNLNTENDDLMDIQKRNKIWSDLDDAKTW